MSGLGRRIGDALHLPSQPGKRITVIIAVLLLVACVGAGAVFGAPALALLGVSDTRATPTAEPPAPVTPRAALRPAIAQGPGPTPSGVGGLLDPLVAQGGLGTLSARVVDPATGRVLWQRDPATALVPGSTAKLLTASAALLALPHKTTLNTVVLAGAEPGTVVLVGGGDPTLSAAPAGVTTVYPGAARLDDLVDQVRAAAPGPVRRVLVDVGRYSGATLAPTWDPADVAAGFIAPVEPVMLDGGRADPTQEISPRSARPATAAATELARRLGADPGSVTVGSAAPGARVLGAVSSPPVTDLIATALSISDNVLAEALSREVARATRAEPSFSGASRAVLQVLRDHGFDTGGATLLDGSGLSDHDVIPATLLSDLLASAAAPDELLASAAAPDDPLASAAAPDGRRASAAPDSAQPRDDVQPRTAALRSLLAGLPVAGGSGTLADRYEGAATGGRGWVRAKTGTLTGVNSLAGTVLDAEGRVLVFALLSNGPDPVAVRPRLDLLAAALRSCGCR